jgi:pimeloyl-ACP methyl ester carboxylesterase
MIDGESELKYLDLHGDRVAYREAGAGEALLLIHGMGGSSATWKAVLPELSKRYRVVAPDLLGHGQSAKPRADYSLGAFAAWLRDLLDELDITRATVVGHSLGGGVAMQFIYQHRDYCERLVLISSGGLGPDLSWILRMLSAPGVELVLPVVAPRPVLNIGARLGSWLTSAGIHSPQVGEIWNGYSSLSDGQTRQAFLRTLRSVVDHRGQAVSATKKLHLSSGIPLQLIWGERTGSSLSLTAPPPTPPCRLAGLKCFPASGTSRTSSPPPPWCESSTTSSPRQTPVLRSPERQPRALGRSPFPLCQNGTLRAPLAHLT